MSAAWGFIGIVAALVILAAYAAHCGQLAQDAQDANAKLNKRMGELERRLDKRNQQLVNLMVENYELHNLVNQAHGKGFIPQMFKHGREN